MDVKKLVLGGVVGFVVLFGFGFIWHVPLLGGFYAEQTAAVALPQMVLPVIILAELIRGFLMAYAYPLGYKGGSPVVEGARFGLLMGLFTAMLPLIYVSRLNFSSFNWFWAEGAFFAIQGVLAGIAIAYVHGKRKQ